MKQLTYTAALFTASLFTATASAGDNAEDILHGHGVVTASEATPYVQVNSGPNGTETDLLSHLERLPDDGRAIVPYQRVSDDRDHRDNLLDSAS